MSFAQMGFSMLERGLTNLSNTYGSGREARDAEYESQNIAQIHSMENQRANEAALLRQKMSMAKELGIHPSVLLGASPSSTQMVGTISGGTPSTQNYYSPQREKATASQEAQEALALENQKLHNDYLKLQISDYEASIAARSNKNSSPVPPFVMKPSEITMGSGGVTAGTHPAMVNVEMPGGEKLNIPDQNIIETGEVLPVVMQLSGATGIPVDTLYTLASLGLLVIPGGMAVRGAYTGYKAYKAYKAAGPAAAEAARQARRLMMKKGGR